MCQWGWGEVGGKCIIITAREGIVLRISRCCMMLPLERLENVLRR